MEADAEVVVGARLDDWQCPICHRPEFRITGFRNQNRTANNHKACIVKLTEIMKEVSEKVPGFNFQEELDKAKLVFDSPYFQ